MKKRTARRRVGLLMAVSALGAGLSVLSLPAAGTTITWTNTVSGYWTNADNWSGGVPGPADDVVFNASGNGSCTIDCDVVVNSLNITNGYTKTLYLGVTNVAGNLTISNDFYLVSGATIVPAYSSTNGNGAGRIITVGGNATIGGAVNANYQGFTGSNGPACGPSAYAAASHGGLGGRGGLPTYGSRTQPTSLGCGTVWSWSNPTANSAGGGAIKLSVGGALTVNGQITANGESPPAGGCSGGSIWLTAYTLAGTGNIQAVGGFYDWNYCGGGGGGRIALEYTNSTFSGIVSAAGGGNFFEYYPSQPGTLSEPNRFPGSGNVTIRTGGFQYWLADGATNAWNFTVTNVSGGVKGQVYFHNGTLILTNLSVSDTALRFDVDDAGAFGKTNVIGLTVAGSIVQGGTSLVAIASGAHSFTNLDLSGTSKLYLPPRTYSLTALRVETNCALYPNYPSGDMGAVNPESGGTPENPHGMGATFDVAGDAYVYGTINADSAGFSGTNGPGYGYAAYVGASHGGVGGRGGLAAYGSLTRPTALGCGSPYIWGGTNYGPIAGGGAIRLNVTNLLLINGAIRADGAANAQGGGGSGGSIWLSARTLSGTGVVQAVGGNDYDWVGGGGGGRLATEYENSTFSGTLSVAGGNPTYTYPGKTGTWFVCQTPFLGACSTGYQGVALASAFSVSSNNVKITRTVAQWKVSQPKLQWTDLSTDLAGNQLNNIETNTLSGLRANIKVKVFTNDAPAYTLNTGTNGTVSFAVTLDSEQTIRVEGPSGGTRFVFH